MLSSHGWIEQTPKGPSQRPGIGNSTVFLGNPLFWVIPPSNAHSISMNPSAQRISIAVAGISNWSPITLLEYLLLKSKALWRQGWQFPAPPVRGVHPQAFPTCSQPLKKVPDWNMKKLGWLFLSRNFEQLRHWEVNVIGISLSWVISILG